jgi:hypothetical protein
MDYVILMAVPAPNVDYFDIYYCSALLLEAD